MAEGLTPPKSDDPVEAERRIETLKKLAKACKKLNVFHLACKKYTQAGDRLKAMKCLLKSGDTKNIVYYAGASRNKDIYVRAARHQGVKCAL
jgi:intraflagellar transport protein 140